jgi:hypothetical protein
LISGLGVCIVQDIPDAFLLLIFFAINICIPQNIKRS